MSKPKKNDTWMPLYIGDYLADTSRLTTEQHGAYLLILMDYWRNGPPLDEDEELATITKMSVAQWRKHASKIKPLFTSIEGRLHQKRAEEERQKAGMVSSKRSEAGKAGAAKRWGEQDGKANSKPYGERIANAMANAIAEPMPDGWQNDGPSHSHSHSHSYTESNRHLGSSGETERQPDDDSPVTWEGWRQWFEDEHGIAHDPYSTSDRAKLRPLAQGWVNAKVTFGQMRRAIVKAKAESTEAIAYLPAYVDRVLSTLSAPPKAPTQSELNAMANGGFGTGMYGSFNPTPVKNQPETIDVESRLIAP